jgi:antitoxin (DNA-binding transcriptional repressor) of toxin-antitoxin stability system
MKTLTATQARQNLGSWLVKALRGEDIGIVWEGRVVALRPVEIYSEDYALQEYGVTQESLKRVEKKVLKNLAAERKEVWDGNAKRLRG